MSTNKSTFLPLLLIIFHSLSSTLIIASNSSEILFEVFPFIRVYKDERIERLSGTQTVHASIDPSTGVQSKDIIINIVPKLNISARMFLPKNATRRHKLPLLVYFHGGAFFTESAFSPTYHDFLNSLVAKANVVAVSVNYRSAPENPLPIGYQDSWLALKWVFSHRKLGHRRREPWLDSYVDFGRVYVGGDSAGANIAHNMAIRAGMDKTGRVDIYGMFLNFPHFWGQKRIGKEASMPHWVAWVESIWVIANPNSTGFDDPLSNPALDPHLSKVGCKRVLVYVAEKDVLRDRGFYYAKALRKSKWHGSVKVVEVKGEDHVFNLRFPNSPKAKKMLKKLALFLKQGKP